MAATSGKSAAPAPSPLGELEHLQTLCTELSTRLARLEAESAIRACVRRYMDLCDHLDAHTPMDQLLDCFTADAEWAGKGARYGERFGAHVGRAAIGDMLGAYRGSLQIGRAHV